MAHIRQSRQVSGTGFQAKARRGSRRVPSSFRSGRCVNLAKIRILKPEIPVGMNLLGLRVSEFRFSEVGDEPGGAQAGPQAGL